MCMINIPQRWWPVYYIMQWYIVHDCTYRSSSTLTMKSFQFLDPDTCWWSCTTLFSLHLYYPFSIQGLWPYTPASLPLPWNLTNLNVGIIAECLTCGTRHLIPLHCWIAFVYIVHCIYVCMYVCMYVRMYVCMSSGARWCSTVQVVTPLSLSTFTLVFAHVCYWL